MAKLIQTLVAYLAFLNKCVLRWLDLLVGSTYILISFDLIGVML
jgi:hypothetical protein